MRQEYRYTIKPLTFSYDKLEAWRADRKRNYHAKKAKQEKVGLNASRSLQS